MSHSQLDDGLADHFVLGRLLDRFWVPDDVEHPANSAPLVEVFAHLPEAQRDSQSQVLGVRNRFLLDGIHKLVLTHVEEDLPADLVLPNYDSTLRASSPRNPAVV